MDGGTSGRSADQYATLRGVAALVARAAPPEEVFAAVAAEVGRILNVDFSSLSRYMPDRTAMILGTWARAGGPGPLRAGARVELGGPSVQTLVFQTGRPARIDNFGDMSGRVADVVRHWGIRSVVGAPITLEGQLWGQITVASTSEERLPADTEGWLAGFIELVTTAIANARAQVELRGYAEEQAALRRVAVLVARATSPPEVFAAISAEVGQILEADFTVLSRYDADGTATVLGTWAGSGATLPYPDGTRFEPTGRSVHRLVFDTGRPARIDHYRDSEAAGPAADYARHWGFRAVVGAPISVEGRLWGVMNVATAHEEPFPTGAEERLAGFTGLIGTAVANAQTRMELRHFAEEQAALRRVATVVAQAAPPEAVFATVTEEVGRLLGVDFTVLTRYDPDFGVTVLGAWARIDPGGPQAIGVRVEPRDHSLSGLVARSGRPARIDYADASGFAAETARAWGISTGVGVPINVEDRLWGVMCAATASDEPLPADSESRLVGFTELVGTALANAEARAALTASRARIAAAADTARQRIERDLHDGAQQHLASLALKLRAAQAEVPTGSEALAALLAGAAEGFTAALEELRELAQGIHPSSLANGGLSAALRTLANRSAVPVDLDVRLDQRLPEHIELTAYYVVAEALTNSAKHADASAVTVRVTADTGALRVVVSDNGRGGADPTLGSGLLGLVDRIETLGGRLSLRSPPGVGTSLLITIPIK